MYNNHLKISSGVLGKCVSASRLNFAICFFLQVVNVDCRFHKLTRANSISGFGIVLFYEFRLLFIVLN